MAKHRALRFTKKREGKMVKAPNHRCRNECVHQGCSKRPTYGFARQRRAVFCAPHAVKGMVNVTARRCAREDCSTQPKYAFEGQRAQFCTRHAQIGMVNVVNKRCAAGSCVTRPSFGYKDDPKKETVCAAHAVVGMVDLVNKRCSHPDCSKHPTYGVPGSRKSELCARHALEGMVNVSRQQNKRFGGEDTRNDTSEESLPSKEVRVVRTVMKTCLDREDDDREKCLGHEGVHTKNPEYSTQTIMFVFKQCRVRQPRNSSLDECEQDRSTTEPCHGRDWPHLQCHSPNEEIQRNERLAGWGGLLDGVTDSGTTHSRTTMTSSETGRLNLTSLQKECTTATAHTSGNSTRITGKRRREAPMREKEAAASPMA